MTTIVTRAGKGSPLTHTEVDTNFTNLNTNKLEAGAIALGSAATPSISFTGDTNTGIYSPGADQVAVATNGVERVEFGTAEVVFNDGGTDYDFRVKGDTSSHLLFVDASTDRVGIGTSDVRGTLGLQHGNTSPQGLNDVAIDALRISQTVGGIVAIRATQYDAANQPAAGDTQFFNLYFNGSTYNYYERMRIMADGRVGIGTTGPSKLLTIGSSTTANTTVRVNNSLTAGSDTGMYSFGLDDSADFAGMKLNYSDRVAKGLQIFTASAYGYPISFSTNGSQNMTIDSSGRLLVGTIASPAHQLQVSTDSAGKPSTNTWTIVSDERIKEEIELADLDLCYQAVKTIPLKRFKWKDEVYTEEQVRDRRKLGWIAQDVEAVFPKAVGTYEFKYNQVFEETIIPAVEEILDDEGNVTTSAQPERIEKGELISEDVIEDCRDLNSDQLYAAMYGAIQKLMVKVETLEAEVVLLKAQ